MNALPSESPPPHSHTINVASTTDLDRFLKDAEAIRAELRDLESLNAQLQTYHEQSKTLYNAKAVKELGSNMDATISTCLKKADRIKILFELVKSISNYDVEPVVNSLREMLYDTMNRFNDLRQKMRLMHQEIVERRYYTLTGQNPDKKKDTDIIWELSDLETGLATGVSVEIQARSYVVRELEMSLRILHRVFLDIETQVVAQEKSTKWIDFIPYAIIFVGPTLYLANFYFFWEVIHPEQNP